MDKGAKMNKPIALLWVCLECTFTRESGESLYNDITGEYAEPWSLIQDGYSVTKGIIVENETHDGTDHEHSDFSTSPCDGCGSTLAGERYAYTLWDDREESAE